MNKNTADITPSMSLQEKSIVENDKNVFQKNSEMTYHFKQWGLDILLVFQWSLVLLF